MHANEGMLRATYEAMGRGDGRSLAAVLAPDATWHIPGSSQMAGDYVGLDALFGFWRRVAELTGGGMKLEVLDVLANDEHAAVWVHGRARRGDRAFEERGVHVFTLAAGLITEAWFHYEDQVAYDDFWS